jgi:hypothetical protein
VERRLRRRNPTTVVVGSGASSRTVAHGPGAGRSNGTTTTAPPPRAPVAESSCGLDGGARREADRRGGAPVDGAGRRLPVQGGVELQSTEQGDGSRRSSLTRAKLLGAACGGPVASCRTPSIAQICHELEASFSQGLSRLPLLAVSIYFSPPGTRYMCTCGWSYNSKSRGKRKKYNPSL